MALLLKLFSYSLRRTNLPSEEKYAYVYSTSLSLFWSEMLRVEKGSFSRDCFNCYNWISISINIYYHLLSTTKNIILDNYDSKIAAINNANPDICNEKYYCHIKCDIVFKWYISMRCKTFYNILSKIWFVAFIGKEHFIRFSNMYILMNRP